MDISIQEKDKLALVQIEGKLTATSLEESLRGVVRKLYADGKRTVILDMEEVSHIDSTGVGELVSAYTTAAREKGKLLLCKVPESVHELLEITNLLDVFRILEDDDEIFQSFES